MSDEREETGRSPREYDKLVRGDIPEIIRESGERPVTSVVEGEAYWERLAEKLVEEAEEYREGGDIEELADALEVVGAIRQCVGVDADELEQLRREKRDDRGGFDEGIVLERVDGDDAETDTTVREQNP